MSVYYGAVCLRVAKCNEKKGNNIVVDQIIKYIKSIT